MSNLTTRNWVRLAIVSCICVLIAFVLISTLQYQVVKSPIWNPSPEHGLSGDMFGLANSLASALAFALFLITLWMQAAELKEQREQFQRMASAQEQTDYKALLQTYLGALTLEAESHIHKSAPIDSYVEFVHQVERQVSFGARAKWVRATTELRLTGDLKSPPSPHFTDPPDNDTLMLLARFLDMGESASFTVVQRRLAVDSLAKFFDSEEWRNHIPRIGADLNAAIEKIMQISRDLEQIQNRSWGEGVANGMQDELRRVQQELGGEAFKTFAFEVIT